MGVRKKCTPLKLKSKVWISLLKIQLKGVLLFPDTLYRAKEHWSSSKTLKSTERAMISNQYEQIHWRVRNENIFGGVLAHPVCPWRDSEGFFFFWLCIEFYYFNYWYYVDLIDEGLYEGDMILSPDQIQEAQEGKFTFSSTSNKNKLWPNAVVPYVLSSDLCKLSNKTELSQKLKNTVSTFESYNIVYVNVILV